MILASLFLLEYRNVYAGNKYWKIIFFSVFVRIHKNDVCCNDVTRPFSIILIRSIFNCIALNNVVNCEIFPGCSINFNAFKARTGRALIKGVFHICMFQRNELISTILKEYSFDKIKSIISRVHALNIYFLPWL